MGVFNKQVNFTAVSQRVYETLYDSLEFQYRGVPHLSVSFGNWLTPIRVKHFAVKSTTLDCNIFI